MFHNQMVQAVQFKQGQENIYNLMLQQFATPSNTEKSSTFKDEGQLHVNQHLKRLFQGARLCFFSCRFHVDCGEKISRILSD